MEPGYLGALLFPICDIGLLIGQEGDAESADLPCWAQLQNPALFFSGLTWMKYKVRFHTGDCYSAFHL